jgi:hypothetical protein
MCGLVTGFIDHLHTRLKTISNYSATAISTIHKSPQHLVSPFTACCVFNSHSLATAGNSGDSSASCAQVLSSQPPVQNSTFNWQLPGWRSFHTNLPVFSSQADFQLYRRNMFTEPLLRKSRMFIRLLHSKRLYALFVLRSLPSNGSIRHIIKIKIFKNIEIF